MEIQIGDIVYLKTDCEQLPRIVTGIFIRPIGIIYYLTYCTNETNHYGIEISVEKNIELMLGITKELLNG
jgi:hypothetical protein